MQSEQQMVAGEYVLVRPIGRGGSGRVYEGYHPDRPTTPVAVKLIGSASSRDGPEHRWFLRETAILSGLSHPDIAKFVDWGKDYLVMEYCPWMPLRERLLGGPIPAPEALRIASRVAGVLDYLNGQGVYHRDIKPENILVDGEEIKVVDFGISMERKLPESQAGLFLGTLTYAPPEAFGGGEQGVLDGSGDLYSLGVVLFEMITGVMPFGASGASPALASMVSIKATTDALDPGDQFSTELRAIVRRLTARDRAFRIGSARDAQAALHAIARPFDVLATERVPDTTAPVPPSSPRKDLRTRRIDIALATAGALLGASLAVIRFWPNLEGAAADEPSIDAPIMAEVAVPAEERIAIPSLVAEQYPSCGDLHSAYPDAPPPSASSSTETWRLFCAGLVFRSQKSGESHVEPDGGAEAYSQGG